ncbi:MAG: type II toxin-antitoxin system RelE/ParE family toxin, partial [Thermoanaerobaculia bacterium]
MTARILVTPVAEAQIERIDEWWQSHRPQAPDLFAEELERAFELLADAPEIGRRYPYPAGAMVRRFLLKRTRNHIYYQYQRNTQVILI